MYAGRPIIQAIDAGNDLVRDADCGVTVPPKNPQALAEGILTLRALPPEERDRLGRNGKAYVLRHHTYDVLAKRFIEAIDGDKNVRR